MRKLAVKCQAGQKESQVFFSSNGMQDTSCTTFVVLYRQRWLYIGREESLGKHEKRSRTIGKTFTWTVLITTVVYIPQSSPKKQGNNILHC